jgi:flagellar biosynthesis/type III secretory pathway protein FliH
MTQDEEVLWLRKVLAERADEIDKLRNDRAEAAAHLESMLTATDHLEKALKGYKDMLAKAEQDAKGAYQRGYLDGMAKGKGKGSKA